MIKGSTANASIFILVGFALFLHSVFPSRGAEVVLKVIDREPPKELGDSIRQTLQAKAVQLLDGDKLIYEFWFCKDVALKSSPESAAKTLSAIAETTLVGAVNVGNGQRDYK